MSWKKIENLDFYTYIDKINAPIVSFNIKGQGANDIGQKLYDDYEICIRSSHCAPLFHEKSRTKKEELLDFPFLPIQVRRRNI